MGEMRNREDLESYLMRSGLPYQEIDANDGHMWVVQNPSSMEKIVIRMLGEFVVFRVNVMSLEGVQNLKELYERLLHLNASEMIHGSYGIADGNVILSCVLRLSNLDYSEYQGTVDDFSLALAKHYPVLSTFRHAQS